MKLLIKYQIYSIPMLQSTSEIYKPFNIWITGTSVTGKKESLTFLMYRRIVGTRLKESSQMLISQSDAVGEKRFRWESGDERCGCQRRVEEVRDPTNNQYTQLHDPLQEWLPLLIFASWQDFFFPSVFPSRKSDLRLAHRGHCCFLPFVFIFFSYILIFLLILAGIIKL